MNTFCQREREQKENLCLCVLETLSLPSPKLVSDTNQYKSRATWKSGTILLQKQRKKGDTSQECEHGLVLRCGQGDVYTRPLDRVFLMSAMLSCLTRVHTVTPVQLHQNLCSSRLVTVQQQKLQNCTSRGNIQQTDEPSWFGLTVVWLTVNPHRFAPTHSVHTEQQSRSTCLVWPCKSLPTDYTKTRKK